MKWFAIARKLGTLQIKLIRLVITKRLRCGKTDHFYVSISVILKVLI